MKCDAEIEFLSGGVEQSVQIGAQMGCIGIGVVLLAAGVSLTPIGAIALVGTSAALTASNIADNLYSSGSANSGGGVIRTGTGYATKIKVK